MTALNSRYVGLGHTIALRQRCLGLAALTDRENVFFGKSSVPMKEAALGALLPSGIGIVVAFRAKPEMGRVNARRVVTGMHDHETIRNRSHEKLVRIPMGADRPLSRHQENAVAIAIPSSPPKPAVIRLFYTPLKNVLRTNHWIIGQMALISGPVVAIAAKLAANSIGFLADNACNRSGGSVGHVPGICHFHGGG